MIIFGASVSAQVGAVGYVYHLRNLFKERITVFGYGGYQMEFAHLLTDDILNISIENELIIVEWFSPVKAYSYTEIEKYLGSLLYNLNGKKILCLILPNKTAPFFQNYHENLISYFNKHSVTFLNLTTLELDKSDIKIDGVHTLENGAKKYANAIFEFVSKGITQLPPMNPTAFSKNVLLHKEEVFVKLGKVLKITTDGPCLILGIEMNIGPFSGYINVNGKTHLLWDKWCGKTRKTIKLGNLYTPLTINPIDNQVERSSSTLQPQWMQSEIQITGFYIYIFNAINKNLKIELSSL